MIIAKTDAYRTDGKIFETEKEAKQWNKLLQYKEAIGNLGEMNDPSMGFLISIANTLSKRKNIRVMLDKLDEIDKEFEDAEV